MAFQRGVCSVILLTIEKYWLLLLVVVWGYVVFCMHLSFSRYLNIQI